MFGGQALREPFVAGVDRHQAGQTGIAGERLEHVLEAERLLMSAERAKHAAHELEVVRIVDRPAHRREIRRMRDIPRAEQLGVLGDVQRHVFALARPRCLARRSLERVARDDLDVEAVRERRRPHVRGVVDTGSAECSNHRIDDARIDERAVTRHANDGVCAERLRREPVALEHVVERPADHADATALSGRRERVVAWRGRRREGESGTVAAAPETRQQTGDQRLALDVGEHFLREAGRVGARLDDRNDVAVPGHRASLRGALHADSAFDPDRVFVIGEAGSNWRAGTPHRDRALAFALIDAAAIAGCDAVKFQTYRAESVYVPNAGESDYLADAGIKESILDIFRDLSMPYELIPDLAAHCESRGIEFMSTPFSLADLEAVDPYVRTHKVASFEISDVRLLEGVARTGKPVVLSTGASTLDDVEVALDVLKKNGAGPVCLLQCTSSYPAPPDSLNLAVIPQLAERFGVPVGFSDHSLDPVVAPVSAVALGAAVIEKHFTLHRALPGPDHAFAVTPDELAELVREVRLAVEMRGSGEKEIGAAEQELHDFAHRTVQAIARIRKGEQLVEHVNVAALRPGKQRSGVHPRELETLGGRRATRDIEVGDGIQPGDWS
jgi:sialic acid synthase SpsE